MLKVLSFKCLHVVASHGSSLLDVVILHPLKPIVLLSLLTLKCSFDTMQSISFPYTHIDTLAKVDEANSLGFLNWTPSFGS